MLAVKVLGCGIRGVLQGAAERSTTKHHKAAGPLLRFAGSITHDRSTCSHILTKSKAAWQRGAWCWCCTVPCFPCAHKCMGNNRVLAAALGRVAGDAAMSNRCNVR